MPFHLESLWGATLMPHTGCAMDWDKNDNSEGGQKLRSGLSRLGTKVHEILPQHRRLSILSNALVRLSISRFVQQTFAIKSRSRRKKPNKCKSLTPIFWERQPQLFYDRFLARPTIHRLTKTKFGWVPFADLRLRSLAMKWNADFTEGGWKLTSNLKRLWTKVHVVLRLCSCRRTCTIVYIMFRSEDIRR